jgi:hypothetical protein
VYLNVHKSSKEFLTDGLGKAAGGDRRTSLQLPPSNEARGELFILTAHFECLPSTASCGPCHCNCLRTERDALMSNLPAVRRISALGFFQ